MTAALDESSRQRWARLVGLLLLLTNASAMFAVSVRRDLIGGGDAAAAAAKMASSETLVRTGLAFDLLTMAGVVPLVAGIYLILKPVARDLALLAAFWRLMECSLMTAITLASFIALAWIGASERMGALDQELVQVLALALVRVHGSSFQLGFLFLGLGQLLFSWLWWKSRYIPRALAGLGIAASAIMTVMAVGIIIRPELYSLVTMAYMAPMGAYELALGFLLLFRGVRSDQRR